MRKSVWFPALVVVVVAAAGAAYALTRDSDVDGSDKKDSDAVTSLTITYKADGNVAEKSYELSCEPTGGDHPGAAEACGALEGIDLDVFQPVPAGNACTMIYGGPETATVVGTVNGDKVNAKFSRENGCEIARWDAVTALFPDFE
ncbi:MAG: hypothetical protein JJE02_00490 [Propionibacteriales bacterium]|nr:hypothetical protein [Propionibacteriales bacterium]